MAKGTLKKMVAPTAGRLVIKVVLSALAAAGLIDDASGFGVLDDPVVFALIIAVISMIKHEKNWKQAAEDVVRAKLKMQPATVVTMPAHEEQRPITRNPDDLR